MDQQASLTLLSKVKAEREKRADAIHPLAEAVQQMANSQVKGDAMQDVRNLALATLGAGVAFRGTKGLINMMRGPKEHKRGGPTELPLPYPVDPMELQSLSKVGTASEFVAGDMASSKTGLPWYGPAMLAAGIGGLGIGWKGMDAVLEQKRKKDREDALTGARGDFRSALLAQYDSPISLIPDGAKMAEDAEMVKVGQALDTLFDDFTKAASLADMAGGAAGMYGMYGGLSGLLAGTVAYNAAKKHSQQAIVEKAIKRRERRKFMQSPTEIYAMPEPVASPPHEDLKDEMSLLKGGVDAYAAVAQYAR